MLQLLHLLNLIYRFNMKGWGRLFFFGLIPLFSLVYIGPWAIIDLQEKGAFLFSSYTYEAALVFGGRVPETGEMNEINRERLDAAVQLAEDGMVNTIVVSNTDSAAQAMERYILTYYPDMEGRVERDETALTGLDTCKTEIARFPERRHVLLVTHDYHLPRVVWQCQRVGVWGSGFAVERNADVMEQRIDYPWYVTYPLRLKRQAREAGLIWLTLMHIYQ
jgi:uncharacterized SAM-binding protein YcdF (DUF218 family)